MAKRVLHVNWKSIEGSTHCKRRLVLRKNDSNTYACPVTLCLHDDFKSHRELRKHIDNKHSWYYYFDDQPKVKKEDLPVFPETTKKVSTVHKPSYSVDKGLGKDFFDWLCTSCGGGKCGKQAKQIAIRAMKFLMASSGNKEVEHSVTKEYVDCCLSAPSILINLLTMLENDWNLSSSATLNYLTAIGDMLYFRKANGVNDSTLRCFTVTEVYIRRGKENLRKKKKLECHRNLDLETLIAKDSWATMEEMERVIPFHINRFKDIVEKCKVQGFRPSYIELAFCTRFIVTFLFLRVKCSRPMTYQFLTLEMIEKCRINGGFIDQKDFKTSARYVFDTLIITEDVMLLLDLYIKYIRPLLNASCNFLLVTNTGKQYHSLTTAMNLLVYAAIGKYINPTRYRQIVETESMEKLNEKEQSIISQDQKHSSHVAKIHYQKKLSRDVAMQGKQYMDKMV